MAKIVTVVGATGAQGKGVVAAFVNNPSYHVRAITRNFESSSAKALSAQGVELVRADLNDLESVKAAFAGSSVIFAVTNFFEPFIASQSPEKAVEVEVQQGINMAAAAAATLDTLEQYIWSTLPDTLAISGGKHAVPHFNGKNKIDAHIRTQLPELAAKATYLWITWYAANYVWPVFTPIWIAAAEKYVQLANYPADIPIKTIADVSRNITPFVEAIVADPAKTQGQIVVAHTEEHTMGELLQIWAEANKTKAQFVQIGGKSYRELWGLYGEEMGAMMDFWTDAREKSWTDTEGRQVLTKKDLGIDQSRFQSLSEGYEALQLS